MHQSIVCQPNSFWAMVGNKGGKDFTSKCGLGGGAFGPGIYLDVHLSLLFLIKKLCSWSCTCTQCLYSFCTIPFQSRCEPKENMEQKLAQGWGIILLIKYNPHLPRRGECCTYVSAVTHFQYTIWLVIHIQSRFSHALSYKPDPLSHL